MAFVDVAPEDLRVDTIRVTGGRPTQSRMTHLPTGTVVRVDDQPTIKQNRDRAKQLPQEALSVTELSDPLIRVPLRGATLRQVWDTRRMGEYLVLG
jgi:hypothetical protein